MTRPRQTLRWLTVAAAAVCVTLLLNAALTYQNVRRIDDGQHNVAEAAELKRQLAGVLALLVDAEAAARSYVVTGKAGYRKEYDGTRARRIEVLGSVRALLHDDPVQLARYARLERAVDERLGLIDYGLDLYEKEGWEAIVRLVSSGHGLKLMDNVRLVIEEMEGAGGPTLAESAARGAQNVFTTLWGLVVLTAVSVVLLVLAFYLAREEIRTRQRTADTAFDTAQMLSLVIDTIPQRIFWKGLDLRYLGCNRAFARDAKRDSAVEVVGRTDEELYDAAAAARFAAIDRMIIARDEPMLDYEEAITMQGRPVWLKKSKVPLHDAQGRVIGILGAYEDITARRQAEQLLAIRGKALESSVNGIIITGPPETGSTIEYVNPALEQISGYPASELVGRNCRLLQGRDTDPVAVAEIRRALREGRPCKVVLKNYRKDGETFWNDLTVAPVRDEAGTITHHVGIVNDITERARHQEALEREANFDALTGLPNRSLLADRLDQILAQARRAVQPVAVVMLDLDNFKFVNDSLGHAAGDVLLVEVGRRLKRTLRIHDTVARYAGDEFVLVLPECVDAEAVSSLMARVLDAVAEPVTIAEHRFSVTCSIGTALHPADGEDPATLLRHADLALYRAKENGRNGFEFFEPEMSRRVHERMWLARDLRTGLEERQFFLEYQPQVDVRTGRVVAVEALVRWRHPQQGEILPARFIPIAEDSALIMPLGEWILEAACRQCRAWHDAGLPHVRVSVNLSALQIRQRGFSQTVRRVLAAAGLDPHYLELEVTESVLMAHTEDGVRTLHELRQMGIRIAIDDFGTGYSSLNYLKRLPVDKLKIDASFVKDVPADVGNRSITLAIIALARNMGLTVIAEGVEHETQLAFLAAHDCDEVQGYHFSRPIDGDALASVLEEHGRPVAAPAR